MSTSHITGFKQVTVWVHDDKFSKDEVLVAPDILGEDNLSPDDLVEIVVLKPTPDLQGSQDDVQDGSEPSASNLGHSASKASKMSPGRVVQRRHRSVPLTGTGQRCAFVIDPRTRYYFMAKPMPPDIRAAHPTLQVSITSNIANTFGYRQRAEAVISLADQRACSASHVELIFRDAYLSRSDMWRLVRSELATKTVYKGQRILFLGSIKAMVRSIYVHGRSVSSAYFCQTTVPVFRSESARYVLFIQMSREMWDFDSEGTGEILFSRVIDGFLPELFKKWVQLEARHLVSIVLFGRLEYDRHALAALQRLNFDESNGPSIDIDEKASYRDFYRVVVADMASGQWTTILDELKKDFRVFLRDITLHQPQEHNSTEGYSESEAGKTSRTRICGRPTSALRGNILEAINIASSQFASDYIDRDLVRTGISIIVITPGTGVFEVNRRLLDLTSENLTNNGVGIDLVCLSKMPLHSVPLFKWLKTQPKTKTITPDRTLQIDNPASLDPVDNNGFCKVTGSSSSFGSYSQSTPRAKDTGKLTEAKWSFGIPQWIDVSYWASSGHQRRNNRRKGAQEIAQFYLNPMYSKTFVPRVRMYKLQMMGLMELGLANISIPYISEGRQAHGNDHSRQDGMVEHYKFRTANFGHSATSPRFLISSPRTGTSIHSARRGRGLLSVQAKQQGDMYERMDAYDQNLFSLNASNRTSNIKLRRKQSSTYAQSPAQDSPRHISNNPRNSDGRFDTSDTDTIRSTNAKKAIGGKAPSLRLNSLKGSSIPTDSRISRSISFALRGLGPSAPRAVASTEINIENAQAEHSASNLTPRGGLGDSPKSQRSPTNGKSNRLSILSFDSENSDPPEPSRLTQAPTMSPSRPILIKNAIKQDGELDQRSKKNDDSVNAAKDVRKGAHRQESHLQVEDAKLLPGADELSEVAPENDLHSPIPVSDISPWIKNVNPANPTRGNPKAASWVGRWQHLYPRAPKASAVKWKSLCTPASVPFTTEEFPSRKELDQQYTHMSYVVSQNDDSDLIALQRSREWLLREMIGLRLSHGYQLVVGRGIAKVMGINVAASSNYFTLEKLAQDGVQIFMTMGNTIQKLLCVDGVEVQVTRYVRKRPPGSEDRQQRMTYSPVIRTILSQSYFLRTMTLTGFSEEYPWSLADSHIAGRKDDLTKVYEQLRFWRARFVVIPVEPPLSARRPVHSTSEDNEEEIHLLGIRELTKMWQKARYNPPEERRFKPTTGKRKDPNPLEIIVQTLNPSEVVATEIEKLLATDDGAESKQIQLLPDSELLERSTSSLSRIAQMLQGEKGVEIANRRWHLRLHYSCFKGDDFTNWLISNFKDINSRDEAVEFGNELMQHGLFHHVSTRHTFKDGNYFYTIAPEHRVTRPESRSSWFPSGRRSDRSVPPTPIAENGSEVSPLSSQSQSAWNTGRPGDTRASEKGIGEKRQVSVSLTKMMRVDVDHRSPKRSERPEIVNLHYDRLHNPENCYHLELAWLNVTSKLIEDAIVNWATQLEKYGLRLVEVPIAEASSVTDREPFRAPYRIVLKVPPPLPANVMVVNGTAYFANASFAPQTAPSADKLIYHKSLLKKFNFVLDMEAASDFPADVDVNYTWGKLGYRYPQFVHRSGVILAQITDQGELFLLANRLYNTRSASANDATGKFDTKNSSLHRHPQASGLVGLNAQNPSPHPSPLVRASSDVLGSKDALYASGMAAYITPEQIKDELEEFCHDAEKLGAFYKEISERGPPMTRKSGSGSSSVLRPVPEHGLENSIPDLRLPASLVSTTSATAKSHGMGSLKKTSAQTVGRDRKLPEIATTDFARRASVDSH